MRRPNLPQVAFLNVSPLLFLALLTLPIASLVRASRAWDVMSWTALILALGAWVHPEPETLKFEPSTNPRRLGQPQT